jgi:putative toxin-antitoxin system antitoxin component (TIGR02293 family)
MSTKSTLRFSPLAPHDPSAAVPAVAEPLAWEADEDQAEASVVHRATQVIGDRSDAMRWLGTPVRALNYATPISLLHDAKGREEVLTVLGRLEHGVL